MEGEPCLLNVDVANLQPSYPEPVKLSVGLHPWKVGEKWQDDFMQVRAAAMRDDVWAIGECGLDKVRGVALPVQMEVLRAHITLAEEMQKPMVIHCVRAFDELLALRKEVEHQYRKAGKVPQPWVVHGFRGKPEQAQQIMAKGLLVSFGHHYHVETLRWVYGYSGLSGMSRTSRVNSFFLETDDLHLSIRQVYEQAALHLGVDIAHLSHFCDPRRTLFSRLMASSTLKD